MNTKFKISFPIILAFLLNIVPVSARSYFSGVSGGGLVQSIGSILNLIFGGESSVVMIRVVIFAIVFIIVYVVLNYIFSQSAYSGYKVNEPTKIIIAMIFGWATCRFLPAHTLEALYATYSTVITMIAFGAIAILMLYFQYSILKDWLSDNPMLYRITSVITYVVALFIVLGIMGSLETSSASAIGAAQDIFDTAQDVGGFFLVLVIAALIWNVGLLLFEVIGGAYESAGSIMESLGDSLEGFDTKLESFHNKWDSLGNKIRDKDLQAIHQKIFANVKTIEDLEKELSKIKSNTKLTRQLVSLVNSTGVKAANIEASYGVIKEDIKKYESLIAQGKVKDQAKIDLVEDVRQAYDDLEVLIETFNDLLDKNLKKINRTMKGLLALRDKIKQELIDLVKNQLRNDLSFQDKQNNIGQIKTSLDQFRKHWLQFTKKAWHVDSELSKSYNEIDTMITTAINQNSAVTWDNFMSKQYSRLDRVYNRFINKLDEFAK